MLQKLKLSKKILIVGVNCLVLGIISCLYVNNYENSKYIKPVSKLIPGDNQVFREAVINHCQQAARLLCDAKILGHDDKYAYALLHRTWYANIHTADAKPGTVAADQCRFMYSADPLKVTDFACMGDDNSNPSIESLYPRQIYNSAKKIWFSWISQPAMDARAKQ